MALKKMKPSKGTNPTKKTGELWISRCRHLDEWLTTVVNKALAEKVPGGRR